MTGWSAPKRLSYSRSGMPCGCSVSGSSRIRSTTLTTRTRRSGRSVAQDRGRRQRLQRGYVARAGEHHVGDVAVVVAAGPLPDAGAARAVQRSLLGVEPVGLRLLAGDHDVDVVPRAQAVVVRRQQRVRVRRQVDPHDRRVLVHHHVEEPGVLVGGAVVVLPPDVRGQQVVEAGERSAPRHLRRSPGATSRAG